VWWYISKIIRSFISLTGEALKNLTTLGSYMTKLQQYLNKNLDRNKSEMPAPTQDNKYDTDFYLIGVDNHASASMTNSEHDFIATTKNIDFQIKGIKVYQSTTKIGTVRLNFQDDQGMSYRLYIQERITYLI
jgi:hypothetical protein